MIKQYASKSDRRKSRTRHHLNRTGEGIRLSVTRSSKFIYAQLLDLATGATLGGVKAKTALEAGQAIGKMAKTLKITKVIFDRGSYQYHGQIKVLADTARESGLQF